MQFVFLLYGTFEGCNCVQEVCLQALCVKVLCFIALVRREVNSTLVCQNKPCCDLIARVLL